jgi:hypothetical protein
MKLKPANKAETVVRVNVVTFFVPLNNGCGCFVRVIVLLSRRKAKESTRRAKAECVHLQRNHSHIPAELMKGHRRGPVIAARARQKMSSV